MSWQAPSTVTVGQVLTAAFWNAQVRDNETILRGLFVRKTATESVTSSTVMQNDDHLVLAVEANVTYDVEMVLHVVGNNTGNFKFAFTLPASTVILGAVVYWTTALVLSQAPFDNTVLQVGALAGNLPVMVKGILRVAGTAGNVQLQWAQNTSNGTATQVLVDSYLRLRAVA